MGAAVRASPGMKSYVLLLSIIFPACDPVVQATPDGGGGGDAPDDVDAAPPRCDPGSPFAAPQPVAGLSGLADEGTVTFSADERTVFFEGRFNGGDWDLYTATRPSLDDAFGAPVALDALNSNVDDFDPSLDADGLTLVFASTRTDGYTTMFGSTRVTVTSAFGAPTELSINSDRIGVHDGQPFVAHDGAVWFASNRSTADTGFDIYRAASNGSGLAAPVEVAGVGSAADEWEPVISADGLTLYLASTRAGGEGDYDVWAAHRASTSQDFPAPSLVAGVNTEASDFPSWISPDDCRLYLVTSDGGTFDVRVARRAPR